MAQVEQVPFPYLCKGKTNILFAARLETQKGIKTLVEVIKQMATDERYFFHVHGSGSLKEYVRQSLNGLGNVDIGEPIFGIAKFMASFDYLIMPSEHEGLALTPIEASLAGLPTIINHSEGLYETLPTSWKLTIYNNDIDEYLHMFKHVMPAIPRSQLSAEAKRFALKNFTIEKMRKEYENVYFQFI